MKNKLVIITMLIISLILLWLPFYFVPQAISCIAEGGYMSTEGSTFQAGDGGIIDIDVTGGECKILGTSITTKLSLYIIPTMTISASLGVYLLLDLRKKIEFKFSRY